MIDISDLKIAAPILLFHGNRDEVISRAEINQLTAKLRSSTDIAFEEVATDHFYREPELRYFLAERIQEYLLKND